MKLSNRLTVIHGVEGGNLVNTHWWHIQPARNLVHDTDAGEAVLALAEIEEGHHRGLFVLWGIAFKDFGDEFFVDVIEFKRYRRVIDGGISMLEGKALMVRGGSGRIGLDARHSGFHFGEGEWR